MFQYISTACASLGTIVQQQYHSMSLGRELLLYCIALMRVAFTGSQGTDGADIAKHMNTFDLPLCNLLMAEKAYIKCMFANNIPQDFNTNTSEPFWGITLPADDNPGEVRTFMSSIGDCLNMTVPQIVRNLSHKHCHPPILNNIARFLTEFKEVQWMYSGQQTDEDRVRCPKQIAACCDYCKKKNGLRILHYAKTWVQTFTSCYHP